MNELMQELYAMAMANGHGHGHSHSQDSVDDDDDDDHGHSHEFDVLTEQLLEDGQFVERASKAETTLEFFKVVSEGIW